MSKWCRYDNDNDEDCHIHYKGCYRELVSLEMMRVYGITWDDACGDEESPLRAQQNDNSPEEFVS